MGRLSMPSSRDESVHVSVRKISNGFIVSHSKSDAKGYRSTETYLPKKPNMSVGDIGRLGKEEVIPQRKSMKPVAKAAKSGKRK